MGFFTWVYFNQPFLTITNIADSRTTRHVALTEAPSGENIVFSGMHPEIDATLNVGIRAKIIQNTKL